MAHTLHSGQRLKSRKQISALFATGKSFQIPPLRVIYREPEAHLPGDTLQFGVAVPSRHFKKAVDRNRIKRLIREAWRLQRQPLEGSSLHIFFIYTGVVIPEFAFIREKTALAIDRLASTYTHGKNTPAP